MGFLEVRYLLSQAMEAMLQELSPPDFTYRTYEFEQIPVCIFEPPPPTPIAQGM